MFHLIGLAHGRRLPSVMKALASKGITVRGLFGESSRAVGAFVQVSIIGRARDEFVGACEYLLREERDARAAVDPAVLAERAASARDHAITSPAVSLADALRVLAWLRWAASAEIAGFPLEPRQVDEALTRLEIRSTLQEEDAAQGRADFLRSVIGS